MHALMAGTIVPNTENPRRSACSIIPGGLVAHACTDACMPATYTKKNLNIQGKAEPAPPMAEIVHNKGAKKALPLTSTASDVAQPATTTQGPTSTAPATEQTSHTKGGAATAATDETSHEGRGGALGAREQPITHQ